LRSILFCLLLTLGLTSPPAVRADLLADFESPVTTEARWILAGGTGLTLAVAATHNAYWVDFENRTASEKPLGSTSKYGDMMGQLVPNALYVGGMWIAGYFGAGRGYDRALYMAEATLYSALVTDVLKYTIREPRPNSTARTSFPSGHATTAFAFAGVVAAEHGWWFGVPAMALATFVGYSRINDNEHRVQDVVAGATVGLSYAYGIYFVQHPRVDPVVIVPEALPGGAGLNLAWSFR
jgi:membrane-associated phospholipid phosphatase